MKLPATLIAASAAAILVVPMASPALAGFFGSITLRPGEAQQISTKVPGLNMHVCNDFNSAGAATVTIADNRPHDLLPGHCAEDIGDRIAVQSHASGRVTIVYRSLQDNQGRRMLEGD
jgi:hypothetical protein